MLLLQDSSENSRNEKQTSLKANDFFSENNPVGYMTRTEFVSYIKSFVRREPRDFIGVIDQMRNGGKFDANFSTGRDRARRDYGFLKFLVTNGYKGYKVILNDGMKRFINDYAEGIISIDFTALELEKAAISSN